MKIHFIFLCAILFSVIQPVYTQNIESNAAQENLYKIGGIDYDIGVVRKFDNRYEGVKGSPFYLEQWSDGTIEFESGRVAESVKLKYNIYEDELLIQDPNSGAIYIDKNNVKSFTLMSSNSRSNVFKRWPHPKKKDSDIYYRILFHGELILLENTKVIFEKANYEGGYSNDKKYDEFKKYTSFYYIDQTLNPEKPQKLKTSANGISKIFPRHQKQVKQYINQNLLDCRKKEDLIKVFEYYREIP